MSDVASDVVVASNAAGNPSDGFEAVANLNAGFLGTGSSALVELSYVAMVLIAGYVAHGTYRYFLPDFSITTTVAGVLGLRD